jgi:ADP-heptose:LPS heptosyltransferase
VKILVVRFSSIGDIVLTSSVVRAIKQQLSNVEIHYLTKEQFASIVISNPNIDRVFTMKKSIDEVVDALKQEQYDWIIDLHNNIRTTSLKRKLKRPSKTFNKLNFLKFLLVRFKWNRMPKIHVVERYFEAVKPLGVQNDRQIGDYFISKNDKIDTVKELGFVPNEFVCLAIGAQFKTKQMPLNLLVEIVNASTQPVVIVGGTMDRNLALEILSKTTNKYVINTCGDYNINQSASIVSQCNKFITNDTGMMHIAACFNVQIVSVWGNTVPGLGMYPYYPNHPEKFSIHQVEGLSCRPCSKIGFQECPKKHFNCMNQQNASDIINEVNKVIDNGQLTINN